MAGRFAAFFLAAFFFGFGFAAAGAAGIIGAGVGGRTGAGAGGDHARSGVGVALGMSQPPPVVSSLNMYVPPD